MSSDQRPKLVFHFISLSDSLLRALCFASRHAASGSLSPCTAPTNHESILLPVCRRHPTLTQVSDLFKRVTVDPEFFFHTAHRRRFTTSTTCQHPWPKEADSRAADTQFLHCVWYGYHRHSQARQYRHGSPRQLSATEQ